jgi:hypothetical protein
MEQLHLSVMEQEQAEVVRLQHCLGDGVTQEAEQQKKAQQDALAIDKVKQYALAPRCLMCVEVIRGVGRWDRVCCRG